MSSLHETKQLIARADRVIREHGSLSVHKLSSILERGLDRTNEVVHALRQKGRAYICYQGSVAMVYAIRDGDEEED